MNIREAIQADLDYLGGHSVSHGCFDDVPERIDFVYTFLDGDKILGCGGIKLLNMTTGLCWTDWTEEALKHKRIMYRTVSEFMNTTADTLGLIRLMAAVRTDFPEAINMVEHLGFCRESIMKKFFGEKDAYMYVRLTEYHHG